MKTLLITLLSLSLTANADNHKGGHGDHPCKEIKEACEAAGFKKGEHKDGKGLWKDCIDKVAKGETVTGVTISAEAVAACKSKHEMRKEKRKENKK